MVGSVQTGNGLAGAIANSPPSTAYELDGDVEGFKKEISDKDKHILRLEEEVSRLQKEVIAAKSAGEDGEDFYDLDRFRP